MANNDRTNTTDERATAAEQSSTSPRLSPAEQNALQFAQNETAAEPTPVDPATGQPVAEPTAQAAAPDVPETITPDADNVVRLPQGVSIDEIRLDGNNLVLVQPDGSTVTILNAALKVPTFLIGDVEIPELALAAALQANGIDVAAGPDGALTVVSAASQSGGGGFNTPNGDIGDAGPVIDLLPPTALQFGTLERRELFPSIRENDFPELSIVSLGTPPGQVNESALASGSGGGTTSTLGNVLVDPGDDGLGSLVVTNASGVSVDVTNGGSIQGVYGELIVTPNGDGTYGFEYVLTTNTIDHANAGQTGADDLVTDTFDFVVTDGNGDTASDELTITITDDGPAIDLAPAAESEIVLDETDNDADDGDVGGLLADLTVPGSALFTETATPGADGAQSKVYSLILNAGATGLTDTLSGEPVVLSEEGGAIVGRTQTGGDEVFRISVDANTGDITVSQSRALFHDQNPGSDAEAHDESLTPEVMNSGLVSLNVVLTDGDGDTASDTAELGALIKFQDDGPAAEAVTGATASVLLDESDGTGSGADGINPGTITGATIEGLFAAPAYGADGMGSVAYTLSATDGAQTGLWLTGESGAGNEIILVKVSDTEYQGVAGGGTPAFTISIDGATGSVTVTQHETLEHTVDGADHDDALALSGAAAISVVQTVTDGDGDTASATSANALGITFEDDGPKAEAVAGATASVLLDESDGTGSGADGINPGTITGATIEGLFAAPAYGADGAGSVAYTLSATNGAQTGLWLTGESGAGNEIILVKVSDTEYQGVAGGAGGTPAFTISIDGATGAVTVTQHETLEHTVDGADHDDALALSGAAAISVVQTVTDGDGDTASATSANALGITFEDDGPKAEAVAGATASVLLDESDGTGSGADGINPGTISGADIQSLFAAPAYGADGMGSVAYTLSATNGAQTGLWLTGESGAGNEIILVKVSDTEYQGVAGGVGGTPAFTITIDGATGAVTVTQHETLEHTVDGADHDDALALSGNAAISVVQTVTDGDGDTASATSANALGITFEDDGPKAEAVAGATASVLLDESDGTGSGADGINPGTITGATIEGLFAAPAYGADGMGSVAYTLSANDGAQTGLWLTGESGAGNEIILVKVSDTEYQGVAGGAGGTPAFTISIDGATGAVTVTQHETLEHTVDGADHDDALALSGAASISVVQTVTDGDGDTASATSANALGITFEDDGPKAEADTGVLAFVLLDESDGTGSGADGINPGTITGATIEGLFAAPAYGADGMGSVAYTLSATNGAQTGLWLTGESGAGNEIILVKVSDTEYQGVAGGAGGTPAFTISIDGATGAVTVTQHQTLEHTADGGPGFAHDDVLALSGAAAISVVQTVTDGDGDTASATSANTLRIGFQDDGPKAEAVAGATASVLLDESDGTGSGADGINPGTITGATIEGLFAAPAYGADGAGSVAYTLSATNGAQTGLWLTGESGAGNEIILVKVSDTEYQGVAGGAGGTPAFTISIDGSSGAVTVTQHETLEHTVDGADHDDVLALSGNAAISVVQTVTDGDGDTASATSANALGITFEDDGPKAEAVAGATASVLLDESDGTGSGADGINPGTISGAVISGLFAAPAYGADGAGSVAYTLSATNGAQTGLWLTGESGAGNEIILVKVSDTEYQGVAGGGTPAFTISIDGVTGAVTVTQHETLEHTVDGADHDDALALSGAAAISVVQTVTDGDGDTASATSANALGITFEDDGPKAEAVAGATASVLLDESDGTGSGADGINPGTITGATIEGLFAAPAYGADGMGSVAYTLSATDGARTGLWLTGESAPGDEIILVKVSDTEYQGVAGGAGGTPAFTISIDGATGAVTVTQHETLEHTVDGADHDDALALSGAASISVVQTVTDGDGDTASATSANALGITFEDDGPKAEAVAGVAVFVNLDESDGTGSGADGINPGTISGADIQSLFAAPAYGADGMGSVAYTLSATNGAQTGLWLTGESGAGNEIILVKVSDTEYQGVAGGAGGTPAFTISIDGATGAVTVTQHQTLEHTADGGPGLAHDDVLTLSGAAAISVVQTVTDGDGDTASAMSANALRIGFQDDGPKAEAVAGATASVLLDESDGTGSGADGINPGTITGATIEGLFAAPAYGADGAGSVAYTLSATNGAQTGLWLTGESGAGNEIILVKVSDTEYQGVAGGVGGTPAFTITIDGGTGAVTVTQHETLEHAVDGADHDDALALSGAAAISVVQTVTDGDGDTASATSANALGITFEDDGPKAEAVAGATASVLLDESDGTGSGADGINPGTISGAVISGLFAAPAYGADGAGSVAYTLSANDGAQTGLWLTGESGAGNEIILVKVSDTEYQGVAGGVGGTPAFTITIDGATGAVTVTQHETLEHTVDGADHDDALALSGAASISVVQTVTDGDGDTASATSANALGITFEDDGPKAEAVAGATASVLLDESDGTGSGADGINPGTITGATIEGLFAAPAYGADGAGSVAYTLSATNGAQTGLWLTGESAPGDEIIIVKVSDTVYQGVAGGVGGTPAFTITIDGGTGAVTVTQHETLEHTVDGADHDDALALSGAAAISVVQTVTDGDGDTASATSANALGITFEDDGPKAEAVAGATASVLLDESDGTGSGADGINPGTISGAVISGLFAAPAYGADGAGSVAYTLSATNGAQTGLWLTGESGAGNEIILIKVSDTEYQGVAGGVGGTPAFTITIDGATGAVTVTQHETLEHTVDGADHDDALALSGNAAISVVQTVTDGDGDTASATSANALGITFEDDGPKAEAVAGATASVLLDESDGTGSGADGINPGTITGATIEALFAAPAFGADGAGSVAYTLSATDGARTGLWLTGESLPGNEIILIKVSDTEYQGVAGGVGGTPAFTITIDGATGAVTVTQHETLEHTVDGADHDDALALSGNAAISVVQTVTDGDGDTASATSANALGITFEDDGPTVIVPEDAVLSNSAGTPQEFDLDVDGMVTDNYGADGAGTVRFTVTDGQDSGLTSGGQPVTYHLSAGGTVLTAKVGGAGGATVFTVTLDPADGTYTVDMDRPVDAFTQVDFDPGIYDFVGGNDPWAGFVPNGQDGNSPGGSPVDDNSRDLLLTPIGASGSSINGNAASAGVGGGGGGQNIGSGEGIRLDFVQDLTGDPAGAPADYQGNVGQQDHLFDGHYTVNGAAVTFGDGSTNTTIQLSAFDDPDGNTTVGDGTGDDITSIVIAYDGENQVITYDPLDTYPTTVTVGSPGGLADRSYTVDFVMVGGARVAEVTGVLDTQVTITSFTADGYNSLEVLYISGDDFAMTGFGTSVVSTDPVDFTLPIEIVDGDGDTAPAEIDITLQPDAAPTISAFTAEVNEAGLAGGTEEGAASTMDAGTLSIALASGDTLDTLEVTDANGNWVDVTGGGTVQGKFGLLTVTANGSGGYSTSYQLNQNSLDHNVRPGKGTPEGVAERFNVRAKDNDGDYSAVDTLKVNVLDDAPEAVADNASLTLGTENFNIAFVLDFSGSVSNSELDAMLDAVKAAGQAFFDGTSGNVQIELVAFSSSASAAGPFTDYASFAAQIDAWNPTEGGSRPYDGGTDFTAAIEETMDAYTPLSDHNNQVFFLSDGNPNEQIGAGGHSLYGSTQTAWNNFVQDNDVTVQTVGIGNNIDVEQLQDVDEADGSDVVVSVSNFDDLVTALLDLTNQVDVSGNVLLGNDNAVGGGDDDILGADGGRILSITVDGVTYTYQDGPDKIFNDGGQPAISGASLVVDGALGGELSFNFETGAWSYQADGDTTPGTESFDYVLVDNDGDTSGASLTIDILPPPGATDDVVLTNITDYSAIDIPTAALLHNDINQGTPLGVDGARNPQNGNVNLSDDVTFTPAIASGVLVSENFNSDTGSVSYHDGRYPGSGYGASGSWDAGGGTLSLDLGGVSNRNMNGAFTQTFSLASAATVTITFSYYVTLSKWTDAGEDVRVLADVDGNMLGNSGIVDQLYGQHDNGHTGDSGWRSFTTTVNLSAGDHTLAFGGLLTSSDNPFETASVRFDNVRIEGAATSFTSGGFDYSVSDGSGFTDDAHVSVTGVSGSTITGTDADEVLVGNDSGSTLLGMGGDDSLVGGDAADLLDGGEGDDLLIGGDGDDLLIGGDGADVLIGGEGQNTYDLTDTDGAIDTVVLDPSALTGMNPDEIIGFSSEDVVDLTELVSLSTTSGDNVGDFVRLNPGDGKELQVDADGTAGGDDWVTVATFDVPQTPASIKILYDDDGSDTSGTV